MNQKEKKRNLTFGNVLLTLLVIGTFVVGGLMYKLYDELTKTPTLTAQRHEQQTQKIEMMSPDDKRGASSVFRSAAQTEILPHTPNPSEQQAASVPSLENNAILSSGTVSNGNKKNIAQKKNNNEANALQPAEGQIRELKPINVESSGQPLQPTNVLPKKESETKRVNPPTENNAKPLKPQPKNDTNDAIGNLL